MQGSQRMFAWPGRLFHWSEEQHEAVVEEYRNKVADAWKEARSYGTMTEGPFLDPKEMFDDVYAELPEHLARQRAEMLALENGGSD